ncbi:MAG: class I SAM-dependent methyltransferase [Candidatus Omnitrophota bacterium]|nr:class I SAM-dependent methyltransferase [Candidatus Omnitrophota bacterium]
MGTFVEIFTPLHKKTARKYIDRMVDDKVHCMIKAKEYEADYWDGNRRYGYGGYKYDGRWKPVAESLIQHYNLKSNVKILDVGCGKAHLLYELKQLLPNAELHGFDVSRHGIADAPEPIRKSLTLRKAQDVPYPWPDQYFDLVIALGSLHNLRVPELAVAVPEIERVGKNKFIMVESYRNEQELFNMECWALTAEAFFDNKAWIWLLEHFGYTGDYEFIYFE